MKNDYGCGFINSNMKLRLIIAYKDMVNKTGVRFITFIKNEEDEMVLFFQSDDYFVNSLTYLYKDTDNPDDLKDDKLYLHISPLMDEEQVIAINHFTNYFFLCRTNKDIINEFIEYLKTAKVYSISDTFYPTMQLVKDVKDAKPHLEDILEE